MSHKHHSRQPGQILREFHSRELNTDDRTVELNRTPLVHAEDVPAHFNLDPEKVALGDFVAGMIMPTKEDVLEAIEHPEQRAARVNDVTLYVFDEGKPTGRHAAKHQPRYTIMGPKAVEQVAAEADKGYQPRHAATPEGYVGRHGGGRMARLLKKVQAFRARHANKAAHPTPETLRHRAPIIQLGAGESLPIGKNHWVPGAGLDVVAHDPELRNHYERTGRRQGEFDVDGAETFTYRDLGRNSTLLYYRERTPNEEEKFEARKRLHRERLASLERARKQQEQEMVTTPPRPYPPHADVYVQEELSGGHSKDLSTQGLLLEDHPTQQHHLRGRQ